MGLTTGQDIHNRAELVRVNNLRCPTCENAMFTKARLVKPLDVLDQGLEDALHVNSNPQEPSMEITRSHERCTPVSTTSRSVHSSSRHSLGLTHDASPTHSNKSSGENTSLGSYTRKKLSRSRSASVSPVPVSTVLSTDGKFILAFTSSHIFCYDCGQEKWSKGHAFTGRVIMAAGSSTRYAVVSIESDVSLKAFESCERVRAS